MRIVRRTLLLNGREISVEEQVEEEPAVSSEPEGARPRKKVYPQVPSPFGIVEEPLEVSFRKRIPKGSVEIVDVTDEETPPSLTASDERIEIQEVLERIPVDTSAAIQAVEISELESGRLRDTFETLHEVEESASDFQPDGDIIRSSPAEEPVQKVQKVKESSPEGDEEEFFDALDTSGGINGNQRISVARLSVEPETVGSLRESFESSYETAEPQGCYSKKRDSKSKSVEPSTESLEGESNDSNKNTSKSKRKSKGKKGNTASPISTENLSSEQPNLVTALAEPTEENSSSDKPDVNIIPKSPSDPVEPERVAEKLSCPQTLVTSEGTEPEAVELVDDISKSKKKSKNKKSKPTPQISVDSSELKSLATETPVENPEPEEKLFTDEADPNFMPQELPGVSEPEPVEKEPSTSTIETSQPEILEVEITKSKKNPKSKGKKSKTSPQVSIEPLEIVIPHTETTVKTPEHEKEPSPCEPDLSVVPQPLCAVSEAEPAAGTSELSHPATIDSEVTSKSKKKSKSKKSTPSPQISVELSELKTVEYLEPEKEPSIVECDSNAKPKPSSEASEAEPVTVEPSSLQPEDVSSELSHPVTTDSEAVALKSKKKSRTRQSKTSPQISVETSESDILDTETIVETSGPISEEPTSLKPSVDISETSPLATVDSEAVSSKCKKSKARKSKTSPQMSIERSEIEILDAETCVETLEPTTSQPDTNVLPKPSPAVSEPEAAVVEPSSPQLSVDSGDIATKVKQKSKNKKLKCSPQPSTESVTFEKVAPEPAADKPSTESTVPESEALFVTADSVCKPSPTSVEHAPVQHAEQEEAPSKPSRKTKKMKPLPQSSIEMTDTENQKLSIVEIPSAQPLAQPAQTDSSTTQESAESEPVRLAETPETETVGSSATASKSKKKSKSKRSKTRSRTTSVESVDCDRVDSESTVVKPTTKLTELEECKPTEPENTNVSELSTIVDEQSQT